MLKKGKKKAKGIEERIKRLEFYDRLKNPPKDTAQEILNKIRDRRHRPSRRETKRIIRDIFGNITSVEITEDN